MFENDSEEGSERLRFLMKSYMAFNLEFAEGYCRIFQEKFPAYKAIFVYMHLMIEAFNEKGEPDFLTHFIKSLIEVELVDDSKTANELITQLALLDIVDKVALRDRLTKEIALG